MWQNRLHKVSPGKSLCHIRMSRIYYKKTDQGLERWLNQQLSCQGPGLGFQHQHGCLQSYVTPVPGDPPSSDLLRHQTCRWHTHMHSGKIPIYIKMDILKRQTVQFKNRQKPWAGILQEKKIASNTEKTLVITTTVTQPALAACHAFQGGYG